jgi:cbb3-type cytochrome oxidase subunit 3
MLLRCGDGAARGMIDYIGAAVLFVFIVAVLVVLWRREHR